MKQLFSLFVILLTINACKTSSPIVDLGEVVALDTIEVKPEPELKIYQAERSRINDLIHTKLEVKFDWDSSFLYGKAFLELSPHFYTTDSLTLDAKGFQINEVSLIDSAGTYRELTYVYDTMQLKINLGQAFSRKDTYNLFIDYVAMPDRFESGGSAAIRSEKGLYFINPLGKDKNKPKQIWTQGETESSSRWFPTIDAPNEKTTQEIYITVDSVYETLSNGELLFQTENGDGSRTDYWKQELPHAPYLFMMAIGDFAIVEDEWRGKRVNYYVEKEYEAYAKEIFPHTPEMLEFFSKKLNYDYPWDKYDQVVVRDYVSGAMENTGAVIYGDFVQGDSRYLIDNSGEDVVAHELFHHWFGDLVTTESWSNLPLNESFATYGEYLWNEYKYGRDQADYGLSIDRKAYLRDARIKRKKLIRYDYQSEMEMFDQHSYQKGGRVLHMLRRYLGDEAFFAGLSYYLHENEFQSAEIAELRLAFEEISGRDLHWFFNQWFFAAGHPEITLHKNYIDSTRTLQIVVEQTQEGDQVPAIFLIPTTLQIISADLQSHFHDIYVNSRKDTFNFKYDQAPLLANFDTSKSLLAVYEENISEKEAIVLYENALTLEDRSTAIEILSNLDNDVNSLNTLKKALSDPFRSIRAKAIKSAEQLAKKQPQFLKEKLIDMSLNDSSSKVRATAIPYLLNYFEQEVTVETLEKALKDSSYRVNAEALEAIYLIDSAAAVKYALELQNSNSGSIMLSVAKIFAEAAPENVMPFFERVYENADDYLIYNLSSHIYYYLSNLSNDQMKEGLPLLQKIATESDKWYVRMGGITGLTELRNMLKEENAALKGDLDQINSTQINANSEVIQQIEGQLRAIQSVEQNKNLKKAIEKGLE